MLVSYLVVVAPMAFQASLIAAFGLLVYPLWHLPWISRKLQRRICAQVVLGTGLIWIGNRTWTPPHKSIEADLNRFAERGDWKSVEGKLKTIESDASLRDVELYYRGLLYLNQNPAPEPERFLAQVPQSSDLFAAAQRLRLKRYATTHDPELKGVIILSLDRKGIRNPVYFRLKLEPPPYLSYEQVTALYADFVQRYQHVFNFSTYNPELRGTVGAFFSVDLNDLFEIPGCTLLFLQRELVIAQSECLVNQKERAVAEYHKLVRSAGQKQLTASMLELNIDPAIQEGMEVLASMPFSSTCQPK